MFTESTLAEEPHIPLPQSACRVGMTFEQQASEVCHKSELSLPRNVRIEKGGRKCITNREKLDFMQPKATSGFKTAFEREIFHFI